MYHLYSQVDHDPRDNQTDLLDFHTSLRNTYVQILYQMMLSNIVL